MKQMLRLVAAVFFCVAACAAVRAQGVSPALYSGMQWRLVGPFRGGRAVAASGISGSGTTFLFGSVDGGVWKTENAGASWVPLFDGQPIASIGALAVAPSNPQVIYAGTGESDIRTDLASGDGVYKSIDGGKTWTNVGLKETRQISRIVVDPKNADVVYVGALGYAYGPNPERGVFKSTDGGKTWKQALNLGAEIGVSDLAIAVGNPSVLFAGTWQAHRPPWSLYAPLEGGDSGIYRTTDAGANWTRLQGKGLPGGKWGRVGVAVAADGKRVYALVDSGKEGSGLYRSDDGGDTWTLANGDSRITSRSWYFQQPTIDPNNPDVVYVPNVGLFRMDAGGTKLRIVRGAPGGDDYHQLWIDPANSARMVLATDQGTTVTVDGGATWSTWFNQPTGQFYHVTTDNGFPYEIFGAQQDSGSAAVKSRTDHAYIWPMDWAMVGGGESGWIVVDPKDNNVSYATSAYGGVSRYDRRTSFTQDINPWPLPSWGTEVHARKYRAPWTPVLVASQVQKGTLYYGTQFILKTADGGLHWQTISPDLTGAAAGAEKSTTPPTVQKAKELGYGSVYSIATSQFFEDLLWAGSDTGLIHLTRDGGKTWTNVTPPEVKDWNKIAMIEASHFDPATAYIAVDKHRLNDRTPYAYRTRDYGKTWQAIASGIGGSAFLNAIREDSQAKGLLFAGTELGVYVSFDAGDHWQPLQFNLPVTSVRDLVIHGDDLIVATHGRAFWVMDNISPLRQVAASAEADKPRVFAPAVATRIDNDVFLGSPFPPDEPVVKGPPSGAMIDYYLPAQAKEVKLEIRDGKGTVVRTFTSAAKGQEKRPQVAIADRWFPKPQVLAASAGMHRFVWDLRWRGGASAEADDDDDYGAPQAPKVAPGYYQVDFTVDGAHFSSALTVQMDPRARVTPAELEEQQRLGQEIFTLLQRTRAAVTQSHGVAGQLAQRKSEWQRHPELQQQAEKLAAAIAALDKGSDAGMGLSQASSGLQGTLRVVESSDRAIPQAALDVYQASSAAARPGIAAWEKLRSGDVAEFNQALQKFGVKVLHVE